MAETAPTPFGPTLEMAHLSPHLVLAEFLGSTGHPDLVPQNVRAFLGDAQIRANALRLARDVFEPVRRLCGPLRVTSGFRCATLNTAVGGSGALPGQRPSAHMDGRAIDVVPVSLSLREAMARIVRDRADLPFEKVIYERGSWLHLQVPRHAEKAGRVALMWWGGAEYPPYDPADPRVTGATA